MKIDYLFLIAFFGVVGILFYSLFILNPKGTECVTNPLTYLEKDLGQGFTCGCSNGIISSNPAEAADAIIWDGNVGLNLTGQNIVLKGGLKNESN